MTQYQLYWTSADKQASYDMGIFPKDYPNASTVEDAKAQALAELLGQIGSDDDGQDRAGIEAGSVTEHEVETD